MSAEENPQRESVLRPGRVPRANRCSLSAVGDEPSTTGKSADGIRSRSRPEYGGVDAVPIAVVFTAIRQWLIEDERAHFSGATAVVTVDVFNHSAERAQEDPLW